MRTNLNSEPTEQAKADQLKSETDQTFAKAEKTRLEALRAFYSKAKRLADERARDH